MFHSRICAFVVASFGLAAMEVWAQPANDDCAGAIPIIDGEVAGDTLTATASGVNASCSSGDDFDVWYRYTASSNAQVTFSLCGSGFDTTLSLFDACGGAQLACSEDAPDCGYASRIDCFSVLDGEDYLLRVSGYSGARGSFVLGLDECSAPANDDCANAIALEADVPVTGNTYVASGNDETALCGSQDIYDVWYSFTPAANMNAAVSLCGSTLDTTLAVFDACGGTEIACDDDNPVCQSLASYIPTLPLAGGTPYLVRVSGHSMQQGNFSLAVGDNAPPVVTSIVRAETGPSSRGDVFFYVYFNRPVKGFDSVSDLVITTDGVSYAGANITTSDDAYDVNVFGLEGAGEISISVNTGSDVRSLVEVPLASSAVSDPIIIDRVEPVFSNVSVSAPTARPGDVVSITLESSEALGYAELLVNGNPASPAKSSVSFEYLVQDTDADGPALVELYAEDVAGNMAYLSVPDAFYIENIPMPIHWPAVAGVMAFAGMAALRKRKPQEPPRS